MPTTVFADLVAYNAISDEEKALLRELEPRLSPYFPSIAERFYDAVWADPKAAAVLTGPDQVERLRRTLIDWMSTGLLGPIDEKFYEKRSRIGRRHVQIGLAHQYMFGAMSVVREAYQLLVREFYAPVDAGPIIVAVNKLLDLELAIMVHTYQLDKDERLIARERRLQTERFTALQTMTAGLAHEVRNPLNAARLQLELLDRRVRRETSDPRLTEPSSLAQLEMQRLTGLLDDFLSFARPPELQLSEVDVAQLVRHVYELQRPNAKARGLALSATGIDAAVRARLDGPKLHQVVLNLVLNAIEATPTGGTISLMLRATDTTVTITVEDNGPGIPPDVQARIYEPFFTTKSMGTGLGMSIVHSLVTLHGGDIALTSDATGTRFDVTVPRRQ